MLRERTPGFDLPETPAGRIARAYLQANPLSQVRGKTGRQRRERDILAIFDEAMMSLTRYAAQQHKAQPDDPDIIQRCEAALTEAVGALPPGESPWTAVKEARKRLVEQLSTFDDEDEEFWRRVAEEMKRR